MDGLGLGVLEDAEVFLTRGNAYTHIVYDRERARSPKALLFFIKDLYETFPTSYLGWAAATSPFWRTLLAVNFFFFGAEGGRILRQLI